jgi:hypothetical protein
MEKQMTNKKIRCDVCGSLEHHYDSTKTIVVRCPYEKYRDLQSFYLNKDIQGLYTSNLFSKNYLSRDVDTWKRIEKACTSMDDFDSLYEIKNDRVFIKNAIIEGDIRISLLNFLRVLYKIHIVYKFRIVSGNQEPLIEQFNYTYLTRMVLDAIKRFGSPTNTYQNIEDTCRSTLLIYTISEQSIDNNSLINLNNILLNRLNHGKATWIFKVTSFDKSYEYNHSSDFRDFVLKNSFEKIKLNEVQKNANSYLETPQFTQVELPMHKPDIEHYLE